jgi:dipeptidyl-peptidase-4
MRALVSAAVLLGAVTVAHAEPAQLTKADYDRAARFLMQNQDKSILNASVAPHWLPGGDRFWYRRQTTVGHFEFVSVDAAAGGSRKPAFDHAAVAAGLTQALGKPVEADELPFQVFRFDAKGAVEAVIDGKLWTCAARLCTSGAAPAPAGIEVASPDGKWLAYVKDNNIWIKPAGGGEGFALTTEGVADDGFGTQPGANYAASGMRIAGAPYPPALLWSPDSTRILTQRVDDRGVGQVGLLQSVPTDGSVRPKLHSWRMPLPNDTEVPMVEPWVFDVAARTGRKIDVPSFPFGVATPVEGKEAVWSPDGKSISLITRDRYSKTLTLYAVDPATGSARTVVSEKAKTFIEAGGVGRRPMINLLSNGDVLWFSERDGQGRLYLYGPDGQVKRVLGTGAGQITGIVRLDASRVWVRANGREAGENPYLTSLYRIDLKTGATVRLTPENAEHEVARYDDYLLSPSDPMVPAGTGTSFSPSGRFFVDTYSTVDTAPVSVLRRSDGRLVATLEHADLSPLDASGGVTLPEAFTATAADGTTTLYGVILRPSNFDPAKRYPVIDQIYPGPQIRRTPNSLTGAVFDPFFSQAMAELGFVVVLVDGRGTPGRGKAFLDQSYGKLFKGGFLEDHVAAIKELAQTRPWMDVDKVGIYGVSGGGDATARAMFLYPDFFKVGVANAGNHDQRGYLSQWGETYNGPIVGDNYTSTSNAAIAKNLTGKLLLMHGDMDSNVSPALTMQVVDALIKANKDFDLLIVPNQGHAWGDYGTRVTWDYFVRNLMGATPPKEYQIH